MSDLVSQPTGNKARHQTAQPHDRVVLADTARAELLRHVAARQSFADGPEYPLIEPVADEEYGEERYVSSECEAEVDGQGYCEGQDQNIPSHESVRQKSRWVGNQRCHKVEARIDQDRRRQRGAKNLRAQDQKGVAGIADSEQGRREQIFSVGLGKSSQG